MSGFAGARARLADALVDAVLAGGDQLAALRAHFSALDPATSLRSLVVNAVDPALLAAVLGPRLSPPWVRPLRAHYLRFKRQYPGDWKDVEAAWRAARPLARGSYRCGVVDRVGSPSALARPSRARPARRPRPRRPAAFPARRPAGAAGARSGTAPAAGGRSGAFWPRPWRRLRRGRGARASRG